MKSHITATAVLGTALFAFGCTDAELPVSPLAPGPSPFLSASADQSAERTALSELTRSVALALQDQGLRQRVKNDMRASRHTVEHKLEFRSYLRGESGGILLAKMAKETGKSREDLLALVNAVRPLEFYMPVPEHRESWRGDDYLLVASLLKDHTVPTAYTLRGDPVVLHAEIAPAIPTLAIVPVETNFSTPLSARVPNKKDQGGQTIGTYCMECVQPIDEDGSGGGGGGGGSLPKGIYYTASDLRGVGEAWLKGKPEIEVHLMRGKREDAVFGPDASKSTCDAGTTHSGYRYFNQEQEKWSGDVLVMDSVQASFFAYALHKQDEALDAVPFTLWEDDFEQCMLRTDINLKEEFARMALGGIMIYLGVHYGADIDPLSHGLGMIGGGFYLVVHGAWFGFSTNDDFLGVAAARESVSDPGYEGFSHIMMRDGGKRNGAISLRLRN